MKPLVGAQLFTLRETTKTLPDIIETLKKVKAIGYSVVQVSAFGKVDPDELTKVLTYHVVQGKILAADLIGKESVKTLEGSRLPTKSLKVSKADIITGNGVVHTIDEVLVPAK